MRAEGAELRAGELGRRAEAAESAVAAERARADSANAEAAVRTDERQALGRLGAVAHDVAEAEDRIDIADLAVTQDLLERNAVAMDVGDDRKSWHADPQLGLVPAGCPRSARRPIG